MADRLYTSSEADEILSALRFETKLEKVTLARMAFALSVAKVGKDVPSSPNFSGGEIPTPAQEPLAKGKFYELQFELQPDDQIIPAGKKLALMIFSSDRDFTLWPRKGTKLSIDLGATSIELPIVGGVAAFERALSAAK